jgi:hypothetical protein
MFEFNKILSEPKIEITAVEDFFVRGQHLHGHADKQKSEF